MPSNCATKLFMSCILVVCLYAQFVEISGLQFGDNNPLNISINPSLRGHQVPARYSIPLSPTETVGLVLQFISITFSVYKKLVQFLPDTLDFQRMSHFFWYYRPLISIYSTISLILISFLTTKSFVIKPSKAVIIYFNATCP